MLIGGHDVFDFVLCSSKLSSLFLAPVFFLFHVFQYMVEVCFSGLSCRGLALRVYSNATLTYVSYHFFLNCSHLSSKSIKKSLSKKENECCWTYMLET